MKKILVIEDEHSVREVILDMLNEENFNTIGAEDGQIGLQLAQENLPDLILCDVMMPRQNGYSVLSELRKDQATAKIPFIFLTAKADQSDFRQGMELGADDYLAKPFTRSELLKAVETRLEKQAIVDQQIHQKLDDLRSSITLSLPHELSTPLNVISNASSLLIDEADSMEVDEIIEIAGNIQRSSQRLHKLIQNFLLYAQLELAVHDPERAKSLRIGSTLSAKGSITNFALRKAQQVNRASDLKLELQDGVVQISEIKLKKIVEELIDNAFKFSHPGTLVRMVSLVQDSSFVLYVIDNGRGMTQEQIADVGAYMQFRRNLYEQQGAGLGLVISKRMVELHGGALEIESIPGQQTTVRIVLPLAKTTEAD